MRVIRQLAAFGVIAAMLGTFGGCMPEYETRTPALYTQYALETESSDGVHCFYDCLRWSGEAQRDTCLSQCDGVAVNVTREPCTPDAPRLCTYEPVPPAASMPGDDGSEVSAAIIGGIFKLASAALEHAGDCDHERAPASARPASASGRTAHREPERHREPAVSRATPDRRSYVVERPRPDPPRKPRTPST